jgi:hypothetical protein
VTDVGRSGTSQRSTGSDAVAGDAAGDRPADATASGNANGDPAPARLSVLDRTLYRRSRPSASGLDPEDEGRTLR